MSESLDDNLDNRVRRLMRGPGDINLRQLMWLLEHQDVPVRFVATPISPSEDVTRPSVDAKLSDLDKRLSQLERSAKTTLESKEEAISLYVGQVQKIPEVDSVYVFESPTGLDIWTLHDSPDYLSVLGRISQVQVDLDRTFKGVYFDFNLLSVSETTADSLRHARQIYKRGGQRALPSEDWHRFKHGHAFDASLVFKRRAKGFPDWEVITLFYSALHLIDIQLARVTPGGLHPVSHSERGKLVALNVNPAATDYHALYLMSRRARYEAAKTSTNEAAKAREKFEQIVKLLPK